MKKISKIFGLGILSLAALACTKESPSGPDQTDAPTISIAADVPATKGFIDGSFPTGSQITVYDWMDVASGTDKYHMSGVGAKYNGGDEENWSYTDADAQYFWLDGTHNFFGWLAGDGTPDVSSDVLFDSDSKVLTVKAHDFTTRRDYDFVYSDVVERTYAKGSTSNDISRVMLPMHHVFSAFQFKVENNRTDEIEIESIAISNLTTEKSATINYASLNADDQPALSYNPKKTGTVKEDRDIEVGAGEDAEVFSNGYYMIWPQTTGELEDVEVVVTYKGGQKSQPIKLAGYTEGGKWDAGTRYLYTLTFNDKTIELICEVEPWEVQSENIDYAQETVSVYKTMTWSDVQSVNYETGEVILKSDGNAVATCTFRIDTPVGATWTASLILANEDGSVDAFSWVEDTKYGIVGTGEDSVIKLKVNKFAPVAPQHICILRITVQTSDMRTIVVNDLAPDTYLDENGVEHATNGYTEFKIIQNIIIG